MTPKTRNNLHSKAKKFYNNNVEQIVQIITFCTIALIFILLYNSKVFWAVITLVFLFTFIRAVLNKTIFNRLP